jgi:hypothetical protein
VEALIFTWESQEGFLEEVAFEPGGLAQRSQSCSPKS